jgi:hypothetical protein
MLQVLRSQSGTKGEFAAMQKNGPVLGVLLKLLARSKPQRCSSSLIEQDEDRL